MGQKGPLPDPHGDLRAVMFARLEEDCMAWTSRPVLERRLGEREERKMRKIWKYPLEVQAGARLRMPDGARLLTVATDPSGVVAVWADVDPDARERTRKIATIPTGGEPPEGVYLGTVVAGWFVGHVYDLGWA